MKNNKFTDGKIGDKCGEMKKTGKRKRDAAKGVPSGFGGFRIVIGVPLVFISYGGSSMVLSMAAIGLLLSVYDDEVLESEHEALPPQERRDSLRMVRNERWRS